ncbi:hypothetical protein RRG08_013315 [Elysia crispata]|uniref:PiggyBac transposable element-derived protein domain-containing protein n=1 Tax=Elysia crispata TaxID=231223 RepID=A0AAE0Z352_9GAST|nr:hypothetical protein RRG08_013315 [Elysia crispata]
MARNFPWSSTLHNVETLYFVTCSAVAAEVMSRNRYQTISRFFHLSDRDTFIHGVKEERNCHDPLHKIKPALDLVLRASQMYYSPGASQMYYSPGAALSIDEAMIPFQGRLYIKGKPNPWGVKVWCLCDAKNGYLCDFSFYTGKENTPMPKGLGHHVVMRDDMFPELPAVPSNTLPDPGNSIGGGSAGGEDVDFDDLTRRFEQLKKKK